MLRAGFSTCDQPLNFGQVETFQVPEQWLRRNEPNGGGNFAETICPMNEPTVLDRDAHPNVRMPFEFGCQLSESILSLGKDLEHVMVRLPHHRENLLDVVERNPLMEEIAHRVDEDDPWSLPLQRLVQAVRPKAQIEALFVGVPWDTPPTFSERFGVAVGTTRRDLGAPRNGIPRRLSPFDCAAIRHGYNCKPATAQGTAAIFAGRDDPPSISGRSGTPRWEPAQRLRHRQHQPSEGSATFPLRYRRGSGQLPEAYPDSGLADLQGSTSPGSRDPERSSHLKVRLRRPTANR
ncbi:MAG: Response regulator [Actinomycetota bacterium]|nr:Response regulator [Actinomycetota bacterium]